MLDSKLEDGMTTKYGILSIFILALFMDCAWSSEGFILKAGQGEALQNGIVVKAAPEKGTEVSILVEQTFQRGGSTTLHFHEQGEELFYVVSGQGTATLHDTIEQIGPGDVIVVPASEIHRISNPDGDEPLRVVFFMDSPELVDLFRAIHERIISEPNRPITPAEIADMEKLTGGGRTIN
jgi:mannose-6-phosphate isomerase-like protein (cupin superfamily)